jgi:hypothetical protein
MRILRYLWMGIVCLSVLAFVACSGVRDSGNPVVLIPVLDEDGVEHFKYAKLETMPSPFHAEGGAAKIYFNPQFNGAAFTSSVAEPHLVRSGNVFVPTDPDSGTVLAAYYFYEHIMLFERRVLLESKVVWPRTVAVYRNVRDLPPNDEGNASYSGMPLDITSILPYDDQGHVALTFNPGVLGHEHLHAHFDAFVSTQLPELQNVKPEVAKASEGCPQTGLPLEIKLLRSWNEGLADFYGAMTSGSPRFVLTSLPGFGRRSVDRDPLRMKSTQQIKDSCKNRDGNAQDPYYNGTQLARALYAVAAADEFPALGADAAQLTKWERAARYVVHRLSQFRAALPKDWSTVDPGFAICFFLRDTTQAQATMINLPQSGDTVKLAFPDVKGFAQCNTSQL